MITNKGLFLRSFDSISLCLCYFIIFFPILEMLENFEGMFDSIKTILIGLYFLVFLNAIPAIYNGIKRQGKLFYCMLLFLAILYLNWKGNLPYHLDMKEYVELVNIHLFRYCIPMLLLGISLNNMDKLFVYLKTMAIVLLSIYGLQYFVFSSIFQWVSYSQEAGYLCATSCIIFWGLFLYRKDYISLVLIPVSILFILLSGSRGPLLTLLLGMVLSFMVVNRPNVNKIISYTIILVILLILWVLLKDFVLDSLFDFADQHGLSTRTIEKMSTNEISSDDSRNILKSLAINYSFDNFPYGTGIFNDRFYLYTKYYANVSKTSDIFGSYCHNYFVELWMQFGLIFGSLLGGGTAIKLFKMYLKKTEQISIKLVYVLLLTIGFFPLLISRSYLTFPYFYLLIGFCLSYKHINNKEKYIQKYGINKA